MEEFLKYIFSDRFANKAILSKIINRTLTDEKSSLELSSLFFRAQSVCREITNIAEAYGPKINNSKSKIKVAALISLPVFIEHYLSVHMKIDEYEYVIDSIKNRKFKYDFYNTTKLWVTDYNILKSISLEKVTEELGINRPFYEGIRNFVIVSFDVDTKHLHVPTIIDAMLDPSFVSKDKIQSPKAWNWKYLRWGLPEYIIPSNINIINPQFEILSHDSKGTPHFEIFKNSKVFYSKGTLELVYRTIRQINSNIKIKTIFDKDFDIALLNALEFEKFIKLLFERRGFVTTLTKQTRDNGYDIIAHRDLINGEGVLIEVKHYKTKKIGIRILRDLIGARYLSNEYGKYKLCIVTSNQFSKVINNTAALFNEIELIEYKNLYSEINKYKNSEAKDIVIENLSYRN